MPTNLLKFGELDMFFQCPQSLAVLLLNQLSLITFLKHPAILVDCKIV